MRISDFDYDLPEELIAQHPLERRDAARMLVVSRAARNWRDGSFSEFPSELREGDTVVVNNTRVLPARLVGRREPTGGRAELLLVRRRGESGGETWEVLARPARRLGAGARVTFGDGRLRAEVLSATEDGARRVVRFHADGAFPALLEEFGRMPLPPYIAARRDPDSRDSEDYQTMFARKEGAVAAPTAALHFTPRLMAALAAAGIGHETLTLHVGAGTFLPVKAEDTRAHRMHGEWGRIAPAAAERINAARAAGGRIVPVGTTSLRLLESAAADDGAVRPFEGETDIFITPGYRFRAADGLITNFHLPRSTLFMLVSALMGLGTMQRAYAYAIRQGYRFYSYGDASLLLPGSAE